MLVGIGYHFYQSYCRCRNIGTSFNRNFHYLLSAPKSGAKCLFQYLKRYNNNFSDCSLITVNTAIVLIQLIVWNIQPLNRLRKRPSYNTRVHFPFTSTKELAFLN